MGRAYLWAQKKMYLKNECGGARRDRTADLYNAIVALSQLSYDPIIYSSVKNKNKNLKRVVKI
jgi:hypothetical protein